MIGSAAFRDRSAISRLIAGIVVVLAMIENRYGLGLDLSVLAIPGLVLILCLNDADVPSLGLRLEPVQGWWYWCRIAICFAAVIGIVLVACVAVK